MKTVLIDASSAILLYKVGLFGIMSQVHRLAAAASVRQELTVSERKGAEDFNKAFQSGALLLVEREGACGDSREPWARLGPGERDTLLALDRIGAAFVVIDDLRGVRLCRARGIPHINALLCPRTLLAARRISAGCCRRTFDQLIAIGRYSSAVIEYARRCAEDTVRLFSPSDDKIHSLNN